MACWSCTSQTTQQTTVQQWQCHHSNHISVLRHHTALLIKFSFCMQHFSSPKKAMCNGHFTTWPGLTATNVSKYLHKSMATVKGHLDQTWKNMRSMQTNNKDEEDDDRQPIIATPQITDGKWTHEVHVAIVEMLTESGRIYTGADSWDRLACVTPTTESSWRSRQPSLYFLSLTKVNTYVKQHFPCCKR